MIIAVGVDLVEVERVQQLLANSGDRFLARVFTTGERDYCLQRAHPAQSLAARFAAKEAVMKCLGTGWTRGVGFLQIEVTRSPAGPVGIELRGEAAAVAAALGIRIVHLSLSHTDSTAIAFAVAER